MVYNTWLNCLRLVTIHLQTLMRSFEEFDKHFHHFNRPNLGWEPCTVLARHMPQGRLSCWKPALTCIVLGGRYWVRASDGEAKLPRLSRPQRSISCPGTTLIFGESTALICEALRRCRASRNGFNRARVARIPAETSCSRPGAIRVRPRVRATGSTSACNGGKVTLKADVREGSL